MSAVIPFVRPTARSDSWSQQEIAEFYRVEAALLRAGIGIASAHGVSDEGEPWFVFCRPDGDTIMHFARIDGSYLIASEVLDHPVRGADFRALIDQIAQLYPHLLPIPAAATGTKLVVHPAALLAALVAAAALLLSSRDVHAAELEAGLDHVPSPPPAEGGGAAQDQPHPARSKGSAGPDEQGNSRKQVEAIILSTMIFAAEALASDHADARSDLGHLLSGLASGPAHHVVQGDVATGTGGGSDAGSGAGSPVQPAVLAVQGSGEGQGTASTGGRIDAAPASRADFSGDRGTSFGRDAEPHAPGAGHEFGSIRTAAEARAVGTGDQPTSATGHAEGAAASSAVSGADGGEPRAPSSQPSTLDAGALPRLAETAVADAGSATGAQALIHAAGQADMHQTLAVSVSRDGDDRGSGDDHGLRADAAKIEPADEGRGHGLDQDSPARLVAQKETGPGPHGGEGDHGSPAQKAAPASGDGAQAAGLGNAGHEHEAGPAAQNDHRGVAAHDSHPAKSDPGPVAQSGHATVPTAAHDQGPDEAAGNREPDPGHDPSPGHGPAAHADPGSHGADPGSQQASLDKAPRAGGQPPSHGGQAEPAPEGQDHPSSQGGPASGPPAAPRATVDHNGNLVFHGETHPNTPPQSASHGPDDPGAHPSVGLVGIADHGPVVHDPYHHG